jgi:peptide/nickel transport system substrate-binding protein
MYPHLATGWKLSTDGMKATIALRRGIPWNSPAGVTESFGEFDAEDVVWYLNISNAYINPKSTHGDAGDFAATLKEARVVDKYTVEIDLQKPLWFGLPLSDFGIWAAVDYIRSKKAADKMGEKWLSENPVGTGPFVMKEWVTNNRGVVEALPKHWRKVSRIKEFEVLQVPELSSRVAMLKTGQVDSASVDFKAVDELVKAGMKFISGPAGGAFAPGGVATENVSVLFPGNLWEEKDARTGAPLEPWKSPVYAKDYPWIGNPWGDKAPYKDTDNPPGMDDMEQARLVRWALAYAIDREGIVKAILKGMGYPIASEYSSANKATWDPKLAIPYDPKKAEEMLDKAGYPRKAGGVRFEITIYNHRTEVGEVALEMGDAIAATWTAIGVKTTLDRSDYGAVVAPQMRKREAFYPIMKNCDHPTNIYPVDWPLPPSETSLTRPGWGCGFESPYLVEMHFKILNEPDRLKRITMHKQVEEYVWKWALFPGIVEIPRGIVVNPKVVKSWDSRLAVFREFWWAYPEYIEPVP